MTVRPHAEVVAALDAAFGAVPRPTEIDSCPCCLRPEEAAVLLSTPRRQLRADDLVSYGVNVMDTVGSAEDFRYFAPRLLELSLVIDGMDWPDLEVTFIKLARADWQSWPEAAILAELMDALWADILTQDPSWLDVGALLCALGSAQPSITQRLHAWSALDNAASIANLHDFVTTQTDIRKGRLVPRNAYWDSTSATFAELSSWLSDGPATAAVQAAIASQTSEQVLAQLADIHIRLLQARSDTNRSPESQET
ncbi:hypothetical protein [Streptomyces sp. NPDC090112]|uniref:hypothetical protein n=1 Tax=Streptomyces sp. NPDC090112 TaxID=3365949 RepID=UPI00380E2C6E